MTTDFSLQFVAEAVSQTLLKLVSQFLKVFRLDLGRSIRFESKGKKGISN